MASTSTSIFAITFCFLYVISAAQEYKKKEYDGSSNIDINKLELGKDLEFDLKALDLDEKAISAIKRVIGGEEIDPGEWPWLVSLQGKVPVLTIFGIPLAYKTFYCGASLLNDRWILTAAHCFMENNLGKKALNPDFWHARLGDIELESSLIDKIKGLFGNILKVDKLKDWYIHAEKVIIHPEYNRDALWQNDIALVKLEEDVPSGQEILPHIQSVTLPEPGDMDFPKAGERCVMKGWGCTASGGSVADTAREVTLPKISDDECSSFWRIDTFSRLCAGHNLAKKGICSGDSGGPLVCRHGDHWVQVGIASFTSASRPGNVPGVFTRVSNYVSWIKRIVLTN